MRSTQDASEAAKRLAAARWSPEARLRAAVQTVVQHADGLDEAQREQLRGVTGPGDGGPDGES